MVCTDYGYCSRGKLDLGRGRVGERRIGSAGRNHQS